MLTHHIKFAMITAIAALMAGCSGTDTSDDSHLAPLQDRITDYIISTVETYDGASRWAFISRTGEIFPLDFEEQPTEVVNGIFHIKYHKYGEPHTDQWGATSRAIETRYALYSFADGKCNVVPTCDSLADVGAMNDGLIPVVRPGERISLVRADGSTAFVLNPIDGKEITEAHACYSEGVLGVYVDGEGWGYIDTTGTLVIPAIYEAANPFNNGVATVETSRNHFDVINHDGAKRFDLPDNIEIPRHESYAYGRVEAFNSSCEEFGFVDMEGQFTPIRSAAHPGYKNSRCYTCTYYGGSGAYTFDGEPIIELGEYDELELLSNGGFLARHEKGDYRYVLDRNGAVTDSLEITAGFNDYTPFFPILNGSEMYDYEGQPLASHGLNTYATSVQNTTGSSTFGSVRSDYKTE